MSIDTTYLSSWRRFDGTSAPEGAPDLTVAHVSDLHGQLGRRHSIYYDNPHGSAPLAFEEDGTAIEPVRGLPTLVAKVDRLSEELPTLVAMSGDTFHGSAETTYTNGSVMVEPINAHLQPDLYAPGNWDFGHEAAEDGSAVRLFDALESPTIALNLQDDRGIQLYDGYRLFERAGRTIGVGTAASVPPRGLSYRQLHLTRLRPGGRPGQELFLERRAGPEPDGQAGAPARIDDRRRRANRKRPVLSCGLVSPPGRAGA